MIESTMTEAQFRKRLAGWIDYREMGDPTKIIVDPKDWPGTEDKHATTVLYIECSEMARVFAGCDWITEEEVALQNEFEALLAKCDRYQSLWNSAVMFIYDDQDYV